MYTTNVPLHEIDLGLPEAERWSGVIRKERALAGRLLRSIIADMPALQRLGMRLLGGPFRLAYGAHGGRYLGEMKAWANGLGVATNDVLALNCSYEIAHALSAGAAFGCTAGVRWTRTAGLVHVRSMDWPLPQIGPATRLFRFRGESHDFTAVGVLGHVGVLSGMVPGGYSVTLNWAPPVGVPGFDWGPAFLLREVLEICGTYAEAVDALADAELSTSVFYLVCGVSKAEACVVERTRDDAAIRRIRGDVLVQANHHISREFRTLNEPISFETEEECSLLESSQERSDALEDALLDMGRDASIDDLASCLDVDPVVNDDSCQQMAFCPRTGDVRAWRWIAGTGSR